MTGMMDERHENEQYFFDAETVDRLAQVATTYEHVCCICAPTLGRRLAADGRTVAVLDIDERFSDVPGFQAYDLTRPTWLATSFDVIMCDPPFFNLSLSQLFAAIRTLSHNDFDRPILISYLVRRERALLRAFDRFDLQPTGLRAGYQTVQPGPKNDIAFYASPAALANVTRALGPDAS